MAIQAWSTTAGSNTSVGGVSIAEGWSPADVNNALRGLMAEVAAWKNLIEGGIDSGGSSNAYTLTSGTSRASYAEPMLVAFRANHTNSGASTLAVDSLTAKDIKRVSGDALVAGDITSGGMYLLMYSADADDFYLLNPSPSDMTTDSTSTLTNKTIDADNNTIQNLTTAEFDSDALTGADAKIVTGTKGTTGQPAFWNADGDIVGGLDVAVADGGTGASSAADARTNLSAAARSQTVSWYGTIGGGLQNKDYVLVLKADHAGTITETTTKAASGSCTATFKINSAALGGTANSVTTNEQSRSHSSSNTYSAGDDIIVTISANSSCQDMSFSIKRTVTLA